MKKGLYLFVVVVLLASCFTPRQLVPPVTIEKVVTVHDTITVAAPVPETTTTKDFVFEEWTGGDFLDSLVVEDSTSKATVVASCDTKTKKRNYKISTTRKMDTIKIEVPIIVRDTIEIKCPACPTLPGVPTDGKFPWQWVLMAIGAVALWLSIGKKKKSVR